MITPSALNSPQAYVNFGNNIHDSVEGPWLMKPGLVSLWDMLRFNARRYHVISSFLTGMEDMLMLKEAFNSDDLLIKSHLEALRLRLPEIKTDCEEIGLYFSSKEIDHLLDFLQSSAVKVRDTRELFKALKRRFEDELDGNLFLYISNEKARLYEQSEPFGEQFKLNFPVANAEAIEAGNCLALGRPTATVFHLMRTLESGLLALCDYVGVNQTQRDTAKNWGAYSKLITEALNTFSGNTEEKEFAKTALAFFDSARGPIRNSTFHIDVTYNESGAEMVFNSVKSFMQHLATKLKE